MFDFVSLPTPARLIASSSEWSAPFFAEFVPLIYYAVGLILFALVVMFIIRLAERLYDKITGHRD